MQAEPRERSSTQPASSDLATKRGLLVGVIHVVLARLEDPQTSDPVALEQFVHFIGGCSFYLASVAQIYPAKTDPVPAEAAA